MRVVEAHSDACDACDALPRSVVVRVATLVDNASLLALTAPSLTCPVSFRLWTGIWGTLAEGATQACTRLARHQTDPKGELSSRVIAFGPPRVKKARLLEDGNALL
jgi:hypothetical protein